MSEKVDPWCCREVAFSFQRVRHTDNLRLGHLMLDHFGQSRLDTR